MDITDLISEFRRQVSDEAQPTLWSDEEVMRYIVDAQDTLVRRTGGIEDVTVAAGDVGSPATRLADLTVTLGNPYSALSPYILRIRSGRLLTAARDVEIAQESDMRNIMVKDYGWVKGLTFDDADTGPIHYGVLGVRRHQIRWVRVPDAGDTCRLHIMRLPFPRLDGEDGPPLEIEEEHHYHLIKWMKHLAYSKEDAETYDQKLSEANEAAFTRYCEQARLDNERRKYRPRTVQYGGI